MAPDSQHRIASIGLRARRRNSRKISWSRDFRIRILNNDAHYQFTLIVSVKKQARFCARPDFGRRACDSFTRAR